jgi:hypothetical protein
MAMGFAWNWTTWLNLAFLAVAAVLGWRFMTTGGPAMLRAMDAPDAHAGHGHST